MTWFRKFAYHASFALIAVIISWGETNWISKQFYVSNLGDNLAVLQGINPSIGPISFSRPVQSFNLEVIVLTKEDQEVLLKGINADSSTESRIDLPNLGFQVQILQQLVNEQIGSVLAQSPTPGTKSSEGALITITVGVPPGIAIDIPPPPTPTPTPTVTVTVSPTTSPTPSPTP